MRLSGAMKSSFLAVVLGLVPVRVFSAGKCPPPMTGKTTIMVHFTPGPNWADFSTHVGEHLDFLAEQMQLGNLQFAGPLSAETGDMAGGLSIYNLSDFGKVEEIVKKDPIVVNQVVTYTMQSWMQCRLETVPENR